MGALAYEDVGQGDLPVVLLHGFLCSRRMWRDQIAAVSREHRTISLDFPAHGRSRFALESEIYTEDKLADLTVELLSTLNIDRAILVGFSMGGGVALNAAIRHPSAVGGLFLADVGGGSADPPQHRTSMQNLVDLLSQEGLDALVDHMLLTPTFSDLANRSPQERARMRDIMLESDADALELLISGVLSGRPPTQDRDLESVRVPTAVLVGELDNPCLTSSSDLARRIPEAEHTILVGAGHMTPMEAPSQFNEALLSFLKSVSG
ncbi:alpha/beta fold hydrolase [Rhodococcus opacus]|uniref:alpha/beta fold hydrolase n=1 Tax=Rhodococcus opacus TaxID=37919 RepID=UPI001CECC799|nr:alpha/beta fold hydrolase [Rhodococcus opacus]